MSEEEKKEMIELITPQKTDKDYEEEIERLNKDRDKLYENGLNYFLELQEKKEEIERLNNIIKEVREFIEDDRLYMSNGNVISIANTGCGQKILEILDKEK